MHGTRGFADVIKVRDLEMEIVLDDPGQGAIIII